MVTVVIVLVALVVVGWWPFTAGPLANRGGARDFTINVNVPTVEQPAQPAKKATP